MKSTRVAYRYALALLETAEQKQALESVLKDAVLLKDTINQSPALRSFLRSPVLKTEKKAAVLRSLFEKFVTALTMDFLLLLVDKNREDVLPEAIGELFRLHDERQGIVTLELRAATEISENQQSAIVRRFEQMLGKTVRLSFSVDATLKGGIKARVGDTVYDGSVRRQLEMLREQFARGVVSN
jgi:F-type H+-transporting ATPase subunit delta